MGGRLMRVGSLFSGVEGMGLGVLAALGGRIVWHSEVDPHASAVLARHFDAPNLGDVRKVDWSQVEPVDVLIGGPPCQAVSQAGRRLGMADERWMWPEAFRAMQELRPRWVLWENPLGLLTGRQKDDDDADSDLEPDVEDVGVTSVDSGWFGHVLGEMASLGYLGRWGCLRSSDVGAPHARARVFLAAADASRAGAGRDGGAVPREVAGARRPRVGVRAAVDGGATPADADGGRLEVGVQPNGRPDTTGASASRPDLDRRSPDAAVALLPTPTTSDAKGPSPSHAGTLAESVALLPTPSTPSGGGRSGSAPLVWRGGTAYRPSGAKATVNVEDMVSLLNDRWIATLPDGRTIDYGPAVHRWEAISGEPAPAPRDEKGRLNPDLPRWMMGYPAGWLDGLPRTAALRCAGNGCQPQAARLAAELLLLPLMATEVAA